MYWEWCMSAISYTYCVDFYIDKCLVRQSRMGPTFEMRAETHLGLVFGEKFSRLIFELNQKPTSSRGSSYCKICSFVETLCKCSRVVTCGNEKADVPKTMFCIFSLQTDRKFYGISCRSYISLVHVSFIFLECNI